MSINMFVLNSHMLYGITEKYEADTLLRPCGVVERIKPTK